MTLLITHSACLEHLTPPGHPERPERLRAIEHVLEHEKFMFLLRELCPRAELEIIALCHPREYIERIRTAVPHSGLVELDDDTALSAGSFEASLRAAGGAILAVDEVMAGKAKNAFVAIRPAGHHAEASTAMGFCLFNNAAIAVRHAQRRHGVERAAIVDFDAYHGNGSQQIFWSDRTVMYCSTHEMPLFPGTGSIFERGEYDNVVNAPLRAGDSGETFREAFEIAILPRLQEFGPDLIVISAGFDAQARPSVKPQFLGGGLWLGNPQDHGDRRCEISGRGHFSARRRLCPREPGSVGRRARHGADAGMNSP
jgi:acetoin utilization deacetylase AcuC-like enzyme